MLREILFNILKKFCQHSRDKLSHVTAYISAPGSRLAVVLRYSTEVPQSTSSQVSCLVHSHVTLFGHMNVEQKFSRCCANFFNILQYFSQETTRFFNIFSYPKSEIRQFKT